MALEGRSPRRAFRTSPGSASENCQVSTPGHPLVRRFRLARIAIPAVLLTLLGGCGEPAVPVVLPSHGPTPQTPAERLIGLAAVAKDKRYTATYLLRTRGRPDRTVSVRLARDGSWRIDVPGGAHGGRREVTIAGTGQGVFQCVTSGCVRIAEPGDRIPAKYDPMVEHPFTDWLDVLSDARAPLTVEKGTSLRAPSGECYAVESNAAALTPLMDPGTYCFDAEGVLTGARFSGRTLLLAGAPGSPPKSIILPGPVTTGQPLGTSPPPPAPSPSGSPSRSG